MRTRTGIVSQTARRMGFVVIVAMLMTACNLGAAAPSEPLEAQNTITPGGVPGPLDMPTFTPTPPIELPATATPTIVLTPREQIQSIAAEGITHRTQEPVTVHVRYGAAVSNLTCSWELRDTGQTDALGAPTTTDIDENTKENTYTFTPQIAGTYVVNCTGIATTLSGMQSVSLSGSAFTVEAKG